MTIVTIKVGPLSGVVPELLESAFEMYKKETIAGRARLIIEKIPFIIRCRACETETTRDNPISACPACGSADFAIIQGTEVFLDKLELEVDRSFVYLTILYFAISMVSSGVLSAMKTESPSTARGRPGLQIHNSVTVI